MVIIVLQQAEFHIFTDHQSLAQLDYTAIPANTGSTEQSLNEQRLHTIWQQKVVFKVGRIALQHWIVYKKGCDNVDADALYRYPGAQLSHIYQCTPTWTLEVVQGYQDDPQAQELLTKLVVAPDKSIAPFSLHQGLISSDIKVVSGWATTLLCRPK